MKKTILLSIWSCLIFVPAVYADPNLTPDELSKGVSARMMVLPEFRLIRRLGETHERRIWIASEAAASFAYATKHELLFRNGLFNDWSETDHTDLYRIFTLNEKVTIVLEGSRHDVHDLFRALENAPYPYRIPEGYFWDIITLKDFRDRQKSNPLLSIFQTGMFEITDPASPRAPSIKPVVENDAFLKGILENKNEILAVPNLELDPYGRFTNSLFKNMVEYLRILARHQLAPSEVEITWMKRLVSGLYSKHVEVDINPLYPLIYDAFDLPQTLKLLDDLGILRLAYFQDREISEQSFYYFVRGLYKKQIHSFHPMRYQRYYSGELKEIPNHSIIEGTFLYSGGRPHLLVDYDQGKLPELRATVAELNRGLVQAQAPLLQRLRAIQNFSIQAGNDRAHPGSWLIPGGRDGKFDCRDRALLFHLFLSEAGYPNSFFSTRPHTYNVVHQNGVHYRLDPQFWEFWPPKVSLNGEKQGYDFRVFVPRHDVTDYHHPPAYTKPIFCGWLLEDASSTEKSF